MGKRGFFTFVLGTAAAAAGVSLVKNNGGLHVTFDITPPKLGETPEEWKARQRGAEAAAEPEGHGKAENEAH